MKFNPYGNNPNPFDRLKEEGKGRPEAPTSKEELARRLSGGPRAQGMAPEMKRVWFLFFILIFVLGTMGVMYSQMKKLPAVGPQSVKPKVDEAALLKKIEKAAAKFEDGAERPTLVHAGEIGKLILQLGARGVTARSKPVTVDDLIEKPADHRGAFVRLEGFTSNRAFEEAGLHAPGVWLWEMKGPRDIGLLVYGGAEPPEGELIVEGVFLRSYGDIPVVYARNLRPKPDPAFAQLPPVPDDEKDILKELADEAAKFEDGEKPVTLNEPRMMKVLALVEALPRETVSRLATEVPYMELAKKPADYRGRFVRLSGRGLEAYLDEQPGGGPPDPLRPVNQVYMEEMNAFHTVMFFFINHGTRKGDQVERMITFTIQEGTWEGVPRHFIKDYLVVEGVFLRTFTYESQLRENDAFRKRTAVVLYARNVAVRPPPARMTESMFMAFVVMGIVVIVIFAIGFSWYARRRSGEDMPMRVKAAMLRREAVKSGTPILGPEAKPPDAPPPPPAT